MIPIIDNNNQGRSVTPELFDEAMNPLPPAEELIRGGWPARKDRLGRAIIAVSLYGGGYDFADGAKSTPDSVRFREYHHVYPKSLLEGNFPSHEINSALNCSLISWKTNRKIAAKNPADYLAERAKDANATEHEVRQRLESHLIPYDELVKGDFQEFLSSRAKLVEAGMKKLCDGLMP